MVDILPGVSESAARLFEIIRKFNLRFYLLCAAEPMRHETLHEAARVERKQSADFFILRCQNCGHEWDASPKYIENIFGEAIVGVHMLDVVKY